MAKPHRHATDIEIAEDIAFQRRAWTVQRVGWVLIAILVGAAVAGLFGDGPLAHTSVASDGGEIRFARIARTTAPLDWRIHGPAGANGTLRIAFDSALMRDLKIENVSPLPARVESSGTTLVYAFAARAGSPVEVTMHFKALAPGRITGTVALNDAAPVHVTSWILP